MGSRLTGIMVRQQRPYKPETSHLVVYTMDRLVSSGKWTENEGFLAGTFFREEICEVAISLISLPNTVPIKYHYHLYF